MNAAFNKTAPVRFAAHRGGFVEWRAVEYLVAAPYDGQVLSQNALLPNTSSNR